MADLSFDDLIPKRGGSQASPPSAGLSFDDLIPQRSMPQAQPIGANGIRRLEDGSSEHIFQNAGATWRQIKPLDGDWGKPERLSDQKPAPQKPPQDRSAAQTGAGYIDQMVEGVPILGPLAKRASAAMGAAVGIGEGASFGDRYNANVERQKALTEGFRRDNPVTSALAGVGGGVAATLPLAATQLGAKALGLTGNTLLGRMGAGAASGGAIGGTDAAIRGEDPTTGSVVGGAVGGLAPPIARAIGGVYSGVRNAFSPQANVAADLNRAIVRDGMTPQQLALKALTLAADRPGVATLADAGGENVRGLVERVAQTPGAGRTQVIPALTGRQQQQMGRLVADLHQLTGTTKTATQAIQQTIADRTASAQPLYQQAMNFNARNDLGIMRAWMQETNQGWGKSALNHPDFAKTLQTEYGIKDATQAPMMVVIDAWKKTVDDMIGGAVRAGSKNQARVLTEMRDRVISAVDAANPAYAQARAAWAGPSRYLDAIEEGRLLANPKTTPDDVRATLARLGQSEQEGYRIGAIAALRAKMGNDPAKLGDMTKYLRSPEMREKVALFMPDQAAADSWARRLDFEVGASEMTGRSLGNTATARRLAEMKDAENLTGDLVMTALSGGSSATAMWRQILTAVPRKVRDTLRSKSDALLAPTLTDPVSNNSQFLQRMLSPQFGQGANVDRLTAGIRGAQPSLSNR